MDTNHANAFNSSSFQDMWEEQWKPGYCLNCHTTGYEPSTGEYAFDGVTCESCHVPYLGKHPPAEMIVNETAAFCGTCHKVSYDEWMKSNHGEIDVKCVSCHEDHPMMLRIPNVINLCSSCHGKEYREFAIGTHANEGLDCTDCHMYRLPDKPRHRGPTSTGHSFTISSGACSQCHGGNIHARFDLMQLQELLHTKTPTNLETQVLDLETKVSKIEKEANNKYEEPMIGILVGLIFGFIAFQVVTRSKATEYYTRVRQAVMKTSLYLSNSRQPIRGNTQEEET
ncbi:MAG: hypothetical protein GTN80_06270 [Nitrososphaeria archaeon]|nr:hypothetical protein [Nitrososphaeria archaeon]NIQ33231.1 hypothetical protein [Nitrososphaeria archaeon]